MATETNTNIPRIFTTVLHVDPLEECIGSSQPRPSSDDQPYIVIRQYAREFSDLIGPCPSHSILFTVSVGAGYRFWHEACVFNPEDDKLYMTAWQHGPPERASDQISFVFDVDLERTDPSSGTNYINAVRWQESQFSPELAMPSGVASYGDGILLCARGDEMALNTGLYYVTPEGSVTRLVSKYHGRPFNSVNDVIVANIDGCIWFTDCEYAPANGKLPPHVYRFDPMTGMLRVVVDGLRKPSSLAFSPDERILYVADSDRRNADGTADPTKASTIYAFDIIPGPFLTNKRLFAFASMDDPSGIKCDIHGNVYVSSRSGIEVWDCNGNLLGEILVPGCVRNFCFGRDGELFIGSATRLWRLQLAMETRGAVLRI